MTTALFHRDCVVCNADVGIEVRFAADRAPGCTVEVLESDVAEIDCAHRPDNVLWLSTDEGGRWCADEIDDLRADGGIR